MVPYDLDATRARAAALRLRLAELLRAREEALLTFGRQRRLGEQASQEAGARSKQEREAGLQRIKARLALERDRAAARHARNVARVERAFSNACSRTRQKLRISLDRLEQEERRVRDLALKNLEEEFRELERTLAVQLAETGTLLAEAEELERTTDRVLADLGAAGREMGTAAAAGESRSHEAVAPAAGERLRRVRKNLGTLWRDPGFRMFRLAPLPLVAVILLIALAGGAYAVWDWRRPPVEVVGGVAAGCWIAFLVALGFFRRGVSRRVGGHVASLSDDAKGTLRMLRSHEASLERSRAENKNRLVDEKIRLGAEIQDKYRENVDQQQQAERSRLEDLSRRQEMLLRSVDQRRERKFWESETRAAAEEMALHEQAKTELERRTGLHSGAGENLSVKEHRDLERLGSEWKRLLEEFSRTTKEARAMAAGLNRAWSDPAWEDPKLPFDFPDAVFLGDARIDLKTLAGGAEGDELFAYPADARVAIPLVLSYPAKGSLLLSVDPGSRGRAHEVLLGTILRVLSSFPAGKAKFLLVDPVGLGQSFSALMHLADFDESLVGGRIWTEPSHIEKKLLELTEHLEKVIQKYLRNRYASIAEYNPEVGPLAEPYRFLVVSDFPSGFTELGLERLGSIVASGARCGVYTLILHDARQKLPASIPMARLQQGSLVFNSSGGGLTLADDVLQGSVLETETPPAAARLTSLLTSIGRRCAEANRVEVPYEVVAPKDDQWWSQSTERGIRVPLGRAGADRLQHLDLGRGTAQHALIAGRTGSGKSTLFHVMITNLAAWYGPRELEFYLIDYKKGVEFKTYAVHGLPHARVVAIESDREFGLSVLQRLDREFARRAERFRKAGVQDFAGYRREGGGGYLPRILLMIDEFQEFFTEEDAIAQEAALLLDRIVRQGRAFGVHVVLGSQTLGGSYTLAKATLGQMGVRIALQCNEADSYLILSDDNAAARLLSRPGEAIYNDMSGMVEGNNPFQIVWLSDDAQERYLLKARDRARSEGWQPEEPMTVFEGNVPADIRNNAALRRRIEGPVVPGDEGGTVAWIGEANAIKGPTEMRFRKQGGANLLIIGQQREAALGVVLSSVISLAAAYPPKSARFVILDGTPPELGSGARLEQVARAIPQHADIVEYARSSGTVEQLDAEVKARQEGSSKSAFPVYLVICGLERFRKLRHADEFDMSGDEGKPSPGKCLTNVLTEGPAQGVHSIVACDSLNNVNRAFTRKTLREFDMRILFQMSPADSSELIDTPTAAKLGLHRGLLYLEQEGTLETFRPYGLPDPEWMEEVRRALSGRPLRSVPRTE
jgi:hypothetical protein